MNNKRDVFTARRSQDCREFVSIDFTITICLSNKSRFNERSIPSLSLNYPSPFIDHARQLYHFNSYDHIYLTT